MMLKPQNDTGDACEEHLDTRELITALRGEDPGQYWDPASGGAWTRTIWCSDTKAARAFDAKLHSADFYRRFTFAALGALVGSAFVYIVNAFMGGVR